MLNAREIRDVVENEFTAPATKWAEEGPTSGWWEFREVIDGREPVEIPELGTVRVVETEGGEGQGDHMHIVFEVTNNGSTQLFKIDGYHSSYGDSEYDGDLYEVVPREKTITVYASI